MTCCLAAKCDNGVVIATDSLVCMGTTKFTKPQIKMLEYGSLTVLYAGELSTIQRTFSVAPDPDSDDFTDIEQLQHRLWEMKDYLKKEPCEFLAVDSELELHILSGFGDVVSGFDYACVGSELGWLGLDLALSDIRSTTAGAIRVKILKVLRAVARRDSTVDGPFYIEVL